jgi:hypothetical protein
VIERERIKAVAAGRPLRDKRGQRGTPMSNESINKTLVLLANILDTAVEWGALSSNPARGKPSFEGAASAATSTRAR